MPKQVGLKIGDQEIVTDSSYVLYDKYSGEQITRISIAEQEHIDLAITTASETFQNDNLSPYKRYEILNKGAQLLLERKEELAKVIVAEVGKNIKDARLEVERASQTMLLSSEEAKRISGEMIPISATPGSENRMGFSMRVPIGVICAITPFNFPLNLSCHKIGPAIAAGNTVVWKPASDTPLSAYHLMAILKEAGLPAGHVNLVYGPGSTVGEWLLDDQRIGKYTFTGSTEVGHHIKAKSGIRSVSLELGNNSPNIVHNDADLDLAAQMCTQKGFAASGQACVSVQRIYAHHDIMEEFLSKLVEHTQVLKTGNPLDENTDIGPLISEKEATRVKTWIDEAVENGARVITGGQQDGAIIAPTILVDVNADMKIVCQEVFGPVLTVIGYDDIDDAIKLSNAGDYGLQSAIFTTNINIAMKAVKQLHTGGVIINDASTYRADAMPYGGVKNSGIGKEGPRYAVEQMTELKTVIMNL